MSGNGANVRVLRIYHDGRTLAHRARERALVSLGIDLALVVPAAWPGDPIRLEAEQEFSVIELPVKRAGDVNRHAYSDARAPARLLGELKPDIVDIHEEPFSVAARQWVEATPARTPIVFYSAQNIDKRLPPPFSMYERRAYRRASALYACSRQAASVARGKGFAGLIEVVPLGYDADLYREGDQSIADDELVLALFGRFVPEKGIRDAVRVLEAVNRVRPARLVLVGSGPEEGPARGLAERLRVEDRLEILPWLPPSKLPELYRQAHLVLVPSWPTTTWVEQFGRVIIEAQASGAIVAGYASGSIREVVGGAAVLRDVGDVEGLADEILGLVDAPKKWERLRAEGLTLSRARTWESVARRQADLYRCIAAGVVPHSRLPRSPHDRRGEARAEFGPTAETVAGMRPFALPILRQGGTLATVLARVLDAAAELRAHVRPRSGVAP